MCFLQNYSSREGAREGALSSLSISISIEFAEIGVGVLNARNRNILRRNLCLKRGICDDQARTKQSIVRELISTVASRIYTLRKLRAHKLVPKKIPFL